MQDNCYTYMHALHYSYGKLMIMMQCINNRRRSSVVGGRGRFQGSSQWGGCYLGLGVGLNTKNAAGTGKYYIIIMCVA